MHPACWHHIPPHAFAASCAIRCSSACEIYSTLSSILNCNPCLQTRRIQPIFSTFSRGNSRPSPAHSPKSLLMADPADKYVTGKDGERRMKGVTLTVPVLTGTCAFFLGKKVSRREPPMRLLRRCAAARCRPLFFVHLCASRACCTVHNECRPVSTNRTSGPCTCAVPREKT
jgi:hypothetical protein